MPHLNSHNLESGLNSLTVVRHVCFFFHTIIVEYVFSNNRNEKNVGRLVSQLNAIGGLDAGGNQPRAANLQASASYSVIQQDRHIGFVL